MVRTAPSEETAANRKVASACANETNMLCKGKQGSSQVNCLMQNQESALTDCRNALNGLRASKAPAKPATASSGNQPGGQRKQGPNEIGQPRHDVREGPRDIRQERREERARAYHEERQGARDMRRGEALIKQGERTHNAAEVQRGRALENHGQNLEKRGAVRQWHGEAEARQGRHDFQKPHPVIQQRRVERQPRQQQPQ